jgi:hypothetical protein
MSKKKITPPEIAKRGSDPAKSFMDIHDKHVKASKKKFKVGNIEATVKVDWGKKAPEGSPFRKAAERAKEMTKEKQPGLFEGIDDVITALQLEENDLTDTLKKLIEAKNKAEEKIEALEGRVDVLTAARKKAEKWLEKKK